MATLYSNEYQANNVTVPSSPTMSMDQYGRRRVTYTKLVLAGAMATTDTALVAKLPANCRVHGFSLKFDAIGGALNIGWQANGDQAANAAGFFAAVSTAGAAKKSLIADGATAGFLANFTRETIVTVIPSTATTTAGNLEMAIEYSVD